MAEDKNKMVEFFDSRAEDWDKHSKPDPNVIHTLLNSIPLEQGRKVLDVACGTGAITPYLYEKSQVKVKAIDLAPERIKIANSKYGNDSRFLFVNEDFLDKKEKGYDFVVIFDAYPHFLDVKTFDDALSQAVKKGGYFAILHDCSKEELSHHHAHILNLSRLLKPAAEEATAFQDNFKILKAEDTIHTYLILGQKL